VNNRLLASSHSINDTLTQKLKRVYPQKKYAFDYKPGFQKHEIKVSNSNLSVSNNNENLTSHSINFYYNYFKKLNTSFHGFLSSVDKNNESITNWELSALAYPLKFKTYNIFTQIGLGLSLGQFKISKFGNNQTINSAVDLKKYLIGVFFNYQLNEKIEFKANFTFDVSVESIFISNNMEGSVLYYFDKKLYGHSMNAISTIGRNSTSTSKSINSIDYNHLKKYFQLGFGLSF